MSDFAHVSTPTVVNDLNWRLSGVSVPGTSHIRSGQGCQDAHARAVMPGGVTVLVVADGAGSASHGAQGSQTASQKALEHLAGVLVNDFQANEESLRTALEGALNAAASAVEAEAAALGVSLRELATTLIVAIGTPEFVATAQVGDGAAVFLDQDDELHASTEPGSGEYLNQTTFLIAPEAVQNAEIRIHRGGARAIAAFSDGLQLLALNLADGQPHAGFFRPLFRWARELGEAPGGEGKLREFLTSPRIAEKTDDDLTLVVAALAEASLKR